MDIAAMMCKDMKIAIIVNSSGPLKHYLSQWRIPYRKEVVMSEGPDVKIQVVYEGGVFKPLQDVNLCEGTKAFRNSQARKNHQCGQKIQDQCGQGCDVGVHSGEAMIVVDASVFIDLIFEYNSERTHYAEELFTLLEEKGLTILEPDLFKVGLSWTDIKKSEKRSGSQDMRGDLPRAGFYRRKKIRNRGV